LQFPQAGGFRSTLRRFISITFSFPAYFVAVSSKGDKLASIQAHGAAHGYSAPTILRVVATKNHSVIFQQVFSNDAPFCACASSDLTYVFMGSGADQLHLVRYVGGRQTYQYVNLSYVMPSDLLFACMTCAVAEDGTLIIATNAHTNLRRLNLTAINVERPVPNVRWSWLEASFKNESDGQDVGVQGVLTADASLFVVSTFGGMGFVPNRPCLRGFLARPLPRTPITPLFEMVSEAVPNAVDAVGGAQEGALVMLAANNKFNGNGGDLFMFKWTPPKEG